MNTNQALAVLKPEKNNEAGLKEAYHKACLEHHPYHGGDVEMMKLVNDANETLKNLDYWWTPSQAAKATKLTPLTETIKSLLNVIRHFEGVKIELIGTWLWVTGNTRKYKEQLKENGFKFSGKKLAWYFHEGTFRRYSKEAFSLNSLRSKWGYQDLSNAEESNLLTA